MAPFDYVFLGTVLAALGGTIVYARLNTTERKYRRYERREDVRSGKSRSKRR